MIFIDSNPVLAEAFKNEEVKEFFLEYLKALHKGNEFKNFIIEGPEKYFMVQMSELKKTFKPTISFGVGYGLTVYDAIERCVDGTVFHVNDSVIDKTSNTVYMIGRLYSDHDGLHIQLTTPLHPGSVTWRDLSQIEHAIKDESKRETIRRQTK